MPASWSLDIFRLTRPIGNVSLVIVKHNDAVRRRDKLAANLPTAELLRGSLLHRTIRHKSGCPKCERGGGHPVLVLSAREPGGKGRPSVSPPEQKPGGGQWIANNNAFKSPNEST